MHIKSSAMFGYSIIVFTLALIFSGNTYAGTMVDINSIRPEHIESAGFELPDKQTISIEAYGLEPRRRHQHSQPYTYAWILNTATRDKVWEMFDGDIDRENRFEFTCKDKIDLPAGNYEVYYASYPYSDYEDWDDDHDFGDVIGHIFGSIFGLHNGDYYNYDFEKLFIRVEGSGKSINHENIIQMQDKLKDQALVSFTPLRRERVRQAIFKVDKPVEVRVYAIGEARRDGDFDFGWINNIKTRERVWELTYRDSKHAGGAMKNRESDEVIKLEPGTYKVNFVTDDTHHYRHWNAFPPFDPEFWGLTVWLENPEDAASITVIDPANAEEQGELVADLTRMRDNDYKTRGFTLKKDLDLHIFALGEGRDGEMYDYGWITKANTHQKVWTMKYHDTEPAGGASKNRMYDGIIHLKAGNYVAHYITDGSHSFHNWNTSPPFDEDKWGLTIRVLDDNYSKGDITEYSETEDKSVIAKIVRVGDYAHEKKDFTIKKDGLVRVYAIGEGRLGEMYDYAYIKDYNTGKVVWEMTYRTTERAGGARKNRLFDDEIYLKAGKYTLHYESDDSHSFKEWNSAPPEDPANYGVTITYWE